MKIVLWLIGIPLACFAGLMLLGAVIKATETPEQRAAADKAAAAKCTAAIMSSFGTSTRSYTDKQAYDAHVRDDCRGFKVP